MVRHYVAIRQRVDARTEDQRDVMVECDAKIGSGDLWSQSG